MIYYCGKHLRFVCCKRLVRDLLYLNVTVFSYLRHFVVIRCTIRIFHLKKGGIVTKCIGSVLYCSLLVQCSRGFSFSRTARPHLAYIVPTCSRGVNNNEVDVARVLCLVIWSCVCDWVSQIVELSQWTELDVFCR